MKSKNQKTSRYLNLGTISVSLAFAFTYLLGSTACTKHTSNNPITESHVINPNKYTESDSIHRIQVNTSPMSKDISLEELYNTKDFDETQYASDHWDEYLEDPDNIDDFPENIFDTQRD